MKLRNFLILFLVIALTGLQEIYICTAMNSNNLYIFKKVPKSRYEVIEEEKAPKKNESEDKYKRTIRKNTTAIYLDNKEALKRTKLGRYDKRCRCQKCYWTGFPSKVLDRSHYMYLCGGCNSCGAISGEVFTHWPDEKIPGIELSLDFGKCLGKDNCPHNGFIFDKRLLRKNKIDRVELAKIKKSDEKYWFYCYSCKEHFLVPMNAIQHPEDIFKYNYNLFDFIKGTI